VTDVDNQHAAKVVANSGDIAWSTRVSEVSAHVLLLMVEVM
jgi:hypothetical protein